MKNIYYTIFIIAVLLTASSCAKNDFLDRVSITEIPEDKVYTNPELANLLINSMYLDVPAFPGAHTYTYDNIADESRSFWHWDDILLGQWFPDNNPMEYWAYAAVRKTNMFLAKIDNAPFTDAEKSSMTGQVKALRAMLYFDMVKRYGGVPVITVPQTLNDDLFVKRESIDASFDFIVKELEAAIPLLPETYGDKAVDVGKLNKNSAKAFLGRVLLFWASPLYNPGGDMSRWQKAASVNKEVMDKGVYSLHPDFRRIMLDKNNEEEVFSVQFKKGFRENSWDSSAQPDDRSNGWAIVWSPVQEFVDAFEMKNGKSIGEPGSGYDPLNPYENRDPRFQQTVIVNGSTFGWQGLPVWLYVGYPETGIDENYSTLTGYLLRKGTDETNKTYSGWSGSEQNWIELRYAEVLLNYAEAKNEASSAPDQTVYAAVELIRQRAGLNPYQMPSGLTKAQMRDKIRHERYIELSFESKRYWDLRRWKTAVDVLNGKIFNAMHITKNANGTFSYTVKPVDATPCVFQEKMYFMPIPQREIEKNPNLKQNPGW
ncbi:MAG TPA: RagB/SusD family nutrient uptake outer membrane protein [Prolixibacteraceae bacterium]|nr:RagB/SusD family nutrient uptake outer membrane protein [Prolixibacteraceae bacterium]